MSRDNSDDEDGYRPYSKRTDWSDVIPVPQNDPPNPIVSIDYRPEYTDVMGYFRAVLASGEVSQRVLNLTSDAISMNGANYTVWHRRWEVVEKMASEVESSGSAMDANASDAVDNSLLSNEFAYTANMALENPKNYQVWNHMRLVSQALGEKSAERNIAATAKALDLDSKNIHAWTHRAWCVRAFSLHDKEKEYTSLKIQEDVRNNSAWNERFQVVFGEGVAGDGESKSTKQSAEEFFKRVDGEIQFAESKIKIAPDNESAWNYLRGISRLQFVRGNENIQTRVEGIVRGFVGVGEGTNDARVEQSTGRKTRGSSTAEQQTCRQALSFLFEILVDSGNADETEKSSVLKKLREIDPVRNNYWSWRSGKA